MGRKKYEVRRKKLSTVARREDEEIKGKEDRGGTSVSSW
jgi:hypothetical protein